MKKLNLTIIPTLLLLLTLTSCDPSVNHEFVLQNDSSYDLIVTALDSNDSFVNTTLGDSASLVAGQEVSLLIYDELGSVSQYANCDYLFRPMKVLVVGNDSLGLNFDINDNTRWNYTVISEGRSGGGACECRIVILDSHIE